MMLDKLGVDQPRWKEISSLEDVFDFVDEVGFPVFPFVPVMYYRVLP